MNRRVIDRQRSDIALQSFLLMAALTVMLSLIASFLFGSHAWVFGPLAVVILWLMEARAPIAWILRARGAVPVADDHPVARLFAALAARAAPGQPVRLYYSPSGSFNAYTVGHSEESAIVVNAPLFQYFSDQELAGILAHELSHVANRDTRFMTIAASLATLISQMSLVLIAVCLITLPLAFAQHRVTASLIMIAVAFFLPSIALFLQARLSQAREFAADLGATELLGNPEYLISALLKLERYAGVFMFPWIRRAQAYFGSHPNIVDRVQRLESYSGPRPPGRHLREHWS